MLPRLLAVPVVASLLFMVCLPLSAAQPQTSGTPAGGQVVVGTFVSAGTDPATAVVDLPPPLHRRTLGVDSSADRALLAQARAGDQITISIDAPAAHIAAVSSLRRPITAGQRVTALGGSLLLVLLVGATLRGGSPLAFALGADNRYSNSHTQLLLWFTALIGVYLATLALRVAAFGGDYLGGVAITENLLALSGLSGLSFGGAKIITSQKLAALAEDPPAVPATPAPPTTPATPAAPAVRPPNLKTTADKPRLLRDLVTNDLGQADIGDFQMILLVLIAVVLFLLKSYHWLGLLPLADEVTLPDVDEALLASFGIGHGAYLIKKAAQEPGRG
ncbi:MAG: hypothetical protein F8N37_20790 [Telmatospirillum sp.]|nr:hypothetical protein [Telmatospirillum sp.]